VKIPFVAASALARSRSANCQRTVNCYVELDNSSPRVPVALYGTPGLTLRVTLGTSPCRGAIQMGSLTFWVAGSAVYKMTSGYVATSLGTIGTSTGRVGLATNGTEVLIVDGHKGWLATSSSLTEVTDADFPDGVTVCACQDGFFVVWGNGTQRFYWNETPNTGADWNGLDFASVEGSPDNLVGGISDHREMWFVGSDSTEVFVNTGDDPLFARSGNGIMQQGTPAPWTVCSFDNSVVWLSASKEGQGMVLRSQGGNPVRFSDHALEEAISGYSSISDAFAYSYQIKGHSFYVLTFPTGNATWVYDAATQTWHQWMYRDPTDNTEHRHRSVCHAFNGTKHLVGDWETGKVYSLEMDVYTDNGDPIRRIRTTQSLNKSGKCLFFSNLIVDMEVGVGLATGQGSDPQIMLRYSNDDGRSWSEEKMAGIGAVGEYDKVVKFGGSLGRTKRGKGRVWELSISDPVKFALFGADADVVEGT
jgi:hypothetical protein